MPVLSAITARAPQSSTAGIPVVLGRRTQQPVGLTGEEGHEGHEGLSSPRTYELLVKSSGQPLTCVFAAFHDDRTSSQRVA